MEELQDAIEDAQYVNAIATQEDGPRPVLPWEVPTEEQLHQWESSLQKQQEQNCPIWDVDSTLSTAIGFFLFSKYVKEKENDYCRMNFCEDVIRFKKMRGLPRLEKMNTMIQLYLANPPEKDQETGEFVELPARTEIDEYDLEREIPNLRLTTEHFRLLYKITMDYPTCSESNVGLKGAARSELFLKLRELEDTLQHTRKSELVRYNSEENITASAAARLEAATPPASPTRSASPPKPTTVTPPATPTQSPVRLSNTAKTSLNTAKSEMVLHTSSLRGLTARLRSNSAHRLSRDVFDKAEAIIMESLRRDYWDKFIESEEFARLKNFLWYQDRRVVPEDFFVMRVLGRGGFGLVTACKKGTSGKLYAMKVMNKKRIKMKKSEQLALNERQALAAVESNFVVNLKYSFHSKEDVFLILDLMTGGDLGYHLHQKGRFPKKECQYYAARIMLGLQALHDQDYVYRDLKPENCLLADDGKVKITDLGLATKITPSLHGAAGTRGYWAPEMLRRDKKGKRMPYGHTVDWFSFGCCVAEFISGSNPFRSEAALNFGLERGKQTKEKAIDCATLEMDPKFPPEKFDPDAADLCRRLLDKNEKTRLGANGSEEIMAHPWFKNLTWEAIISDRKRPPYIPPKDVNAASQSEIGTFAEEKASLEVTESDDKIYNQWDWTNPRAFGAEVIEFLIYERETGEPLVPIAQNASCCAVL